MERVFAENEFGVTNYMFSATRQDEDILNFKSCIRICFI